MPSPEIPTMTYGGKEMVSLAVQMDEERRCVKLRFSKYDCAKLFNLGR